MMLWEPWGEIKGKVVGRPHNGAKHCRGAGIPTAECTILPTSTLKAVKLVQSKVVHHYDPSQRTMKETVQISM